jgi:2-keto-3-deoxy-galactonokinase
LRREQRRGEQRRDKAQVLDEALVFERQVQQHEKHDDACQRQAHALREYAQQHEQEPELDRLQLLEVRALPLVQYRERERHADEVKR